MLGINLGFTAFEQAYPIFKFIWIKKINLLRLFRSNTIGNIVFLILVFIGLRIVAFLQPIGTPTEEGGYAYVVLLQWLGPSGTLPLLISSLSVLIQGLVVNSLVNNNNLTTEKSTYAGFLYVILSSMTLAFFPMSAIVWANTFMVIALYNFFLFSQKADVSTKVFNVGFFIGLSAFFYQPYLFLFLYFLLRMGSLKNLQGKDLVQLFTGLIVPYILIWVAAFMTETTDLFTMLQVKGQFRFLQSPIAFPSQVLWIILGFFFLMLVFVLFKYADMTYKSNLMVKRKVSLLFELLLMTGLVLPFQHLISLQDMMSVIPFLAPLMAIAVLQIKRQMVAEFIPLLMLILLLFMQYYFGM